MPKNSESMDFIIKTIIKGIGRRTTMNFAIITVHTIIKKLEAKYDFLRYIEIDSENYSEGVNAVQINNAIDSVNAINLGKAVNEIIDALTKSLEEEPSYYFITEIKDEIESKFESLDKEFGLNLSFKQLNYIARRIEKTKTSSGISIKNSYASELILKTLINVLNRKIPEAQVVKTLRTSINKLEGVHDTLKYVIISDTPDSNGYYDIEINPDIDYAISVKVIAALEKLIEEVGKSIKWTTESSFLKEFQNTLGDDGLSVIKKFGIVFDRMESTLQKQENELITRKTLKTILETVGKKTSVIHAVETIDYVIKNARLKHDVLKYITIDASRYNEGVNALLIDADINSVESYQLGKALWEIIKKVQEINRDANFIDEFKKGLGSESLQKIEDMGINLHLLEMIG